MDGPLTHHIEVVSRLAALPENQFTRSPVLHDDPLTDSQQIIFLKQVERRIVLQEIKNP